MVITRMILIFTLFLVFTLASADTCALLGESLTINVPKDLEAQRPFLEKAVQRIMAKNIGVPASSMPNGERFSIVLDSKELAYWEIRFLPQSSQTVTILAAHRLDHHNKPFSKLQDTFSWQLANQLSFTSSHATYDINGELIPVTLSKANAAFIYALADLGPEEIDAAFKHPITAVRTDSGLIHFIGLVRPKEKSGFFVALTLYFDSARNAYSVRTAARQEVNLKVNENTLQSLPSSPSIRRIDTTPLIAVKPRSLLDYDLSSVGRRFSQLVRVVDTDGKVHWYELKYELNVRFQNLALKILRPLKTDTPENADVYNKVMNFYPFEHYRQYYGKELDDRRYALNLGPDAVSWSFQLFHMHSILFGARPSDLQEAFKKIDWGIDAIRKPNGRWSIAAMGWNDDHSRAFLFILKRDGKNPRLAYLNEILPISTVTAQELTRNPKTKHMLLEDFFRLP